MTWERSAYSSLFRGEHFDLECGEHPTGWTAAIFMTGETDGCSAWVTVPTLPGSTRDEAETAAIVAARELSAELALLARKASLP